MPDSQAVVTIRQETLQKELNKILDLATDPKVDPEKLNPKEHAELLSALSKVIRLLKSCK